MSYCYRLKMLSEYELRQGAVLSQRVVAVTGKEHLDQSGRYIEVLTEEVITYEQALTAMAESRFAAHPKPRET